MDNYQLTKKEDHWQLIKDGAARASLTGANKKQTLEKVHEFLQDKEASLKIHGEDGKIQEERTYPRSSDPRKTEG